MVATVAGGIALLEAAALVMLVPLKEVEPYTLLVDRQTGHVEALIPTAEQNITADAALTRSFLVQYVVARESFDAASIERDYRKVGLFSAAQERQRYFALMNAANPESPLAYMPRGGAIMVDIRSVSSLSATSSLVRFTTRRMDTRSAGADIQHWAAVISWTYSNAGMTADDRLLNPLGFQVTRYRRDPETLAESTSPPATATTSLRPSVTVAPGVPQGPAR